MKYKLSMKLLIVLSLTHLALCFKSSSQIWNCNSTEVNSVYICILSNIKLLDHETNVSINGNHKKWYEDTNISRLQFISSTVYYLPPIVCQKFTNLEILDLDNIQLQEVLSQTFFNCTRMRTLLLTRNELAEIGYGIFDRMLNLVEINLAGNKLIHINAFAFYGLSRLRFLYIDKNNLDASQEKFFGLINLRTLSLDLNDFNYLNGNLLDDYPALTTVTFSYNEMVFISEDFFKSNSPLTKLALDNNRLSFMHSSPFNELSHLRILYLQYNQIQYVHRKLFERLINLQELRIDNNLISSIDSQAFVNLSVLKIINLSKNLFSSVNTNPRVPLQHLRALESLDLSFNKIHYLNDDFGLSENVNLKQLTLNNNKIYYIHPNLLRKLQELQIVYLQINQLEVIDSSTFAFNTKMERLFLNNNSLTRIDSDLIANLNKLDRLDFSNNSIDEISSDFLTYLPKIEILRFQGNICISRNFNNNTVQAEDKFFTKCYTNYENRKTITQTMPSISTTPWISLAKSRAITYFQCPIKCQILILFLFSVII
jgi:Leucine-rich repeat (LRR) protein